MRVIANSLPKSGTHILVRFLEIAGLKENLPNFAAGQIRLTNINPIQLIRKKSRRWKEGMDEIGLSIDIDNLELKVKKKWIEQQIFLTPENCFHKAHLPYSKELESIILSNGFKILFIIRDPRDVAISHINWVLGNKRHPEYGRFASLNKIEDKIRLLFLSQMYNDGYLKQLSDLLLFKFRIINYKKYTNEYRVSSINSRLKNVIGWCDSKNVFDVKFEELIGSKGGGSNTKQSRTIKKLLSHLDLDIDKKLHDDIVKNLFYTKAKTFHKGVIGQWQTKFNNETRKIFKEYCGEYLIKLGYEKDFNW